MSTHYQTTSLVATTPLPAVKEAEIERRTSQYHPSIWGDYFVSYTSDESTMHTWNEEAEILKKKVMTMLTSDFGGKPLVEKLNLIDVIQRLGIAYHFERELEEALNQINTDYENYLCNVEDNLYTASLLFRLLREHGFNISSDIFNKLKDNKGTFKEELLLDVEGMLSLYEATQLRVHGETILDEALIYVESKLQSMVSNFDHCTAKQVLHALRRPLRKNVTRLCAREYISFYQEIGSHNEILLKFAKLDFNILQSQHRKELSVIAKWWKELEFNKKLPFARDRLPECYFWIMGVYHEPYYAKARKFNTKLISLISIIDDIYDNYGVKYELELFNNAVERWEISALDKLPDYMKPCYQALLDVYDEMEKEMIKEGRAYAIYFAKEAVKRQVKAYFDEFMWLGSGKIPTLEEYLKIALVSTGYPMLATTSLVGMGGVATEEAFNWLLTEPQILKASSVMSRVMDDVVSNKREQERGHIPSAVQCYMNQYGVSEEETCTYFNQVVEDSWKDINQAFLELKGIPSRLLFGLCQKYSPSTIVTNPLAPTVSTLLTRILNLARVMFLLYTGEDNYTNSKTNLKQHITCVLVDAVEI